MLTGIARTLGITLAAVALVPAGALGQSRVEQRRPADRDAMIEIDNPLGSIKIVGWDRAEVLVTGTLGRAAEGLELTGTSHRVKIAALTRGHPHSAQSDLEVRVPAGSRLSVESFSSRIAISEVTGRVRAESVNGSISISGSPTEVDVETVSGAIEVSGVSRRVKAEGTNGSVTVRGAAGRIEASTVNGRLQVTGSSVEEARLETVNGALVFEGSLLANGSLNAESVNGAIELRLPANVAADFSISSFGGDVDSDFGVQLRPIERRERGRGRQERERGHGNAEKEIQFSTGGGGAKVSVTTLNGHVSIRKQSK